MDTRQHLYFIAQQTEAYYRVLQGVIGLLVTKLILIVFLSAWNERLSGTPQCV